jgi:hypothetical protein
MVTLGEQLTSGNSVVCTSFETEPCGTACGTREGHGAEHSDDKLVVSKKCMLGICWNIKHLQSQVYQQRMLWAGNELIIWFTESCNV